MKMDSDAGMYTLTQCVGESPVGSIHDSPKHFTPQAGYISSMHVPPAGWCGGDSHITTLGGCDGAGENTTSYGHEVHPDEATAMGYCDPYVSYQQTVADACHEIGSYSYPGPHDGSNHPPHQPTEGEDTCAVYGNNNNRYDYSKQSDNNNQQQVLTTRSGRYPRTKNSTTRGRVSKSGNNNSRKPVSPVKSASSEASEEENNSDTSSSNVSNYDNVMVWLNHQACGGTVKRKRRITKTQRVAANHRERKRMVHLNTAFESLRETIPSFPFEKKLSRIQTLKLAIDYIGFMTEILYGKDTVPTQAYYSGSESPEMNRDIHYW